MQVPKQPISNSIIELGIVIVVKLVHIENAISFIVVKDIGSETDCNDLHTPNAAVCISVNVFEKVTFARDIQ
jgi:hypothetical protein